MISAKMDSTIKMNKLTARIATLECLRLNARAANTRSLITTSPHWMHNGIPDALFVPLATNPLLMEITLCMTDNPIAKLISMP